MVRPLQGIDAEHSDPHLRETALCNRARTADRPTCTCMLTVTHPERARFLMAPHEVCLICVVATSFVHSDPGGQVLKSYHNIPGGTRLVSHASTLIALFLTHDGKAVTAAPRSADVKDSTAVTYAGMEVLAFHGKAAFTSRPKAW